MVTANESPSSPEKPPLTRSVRRKAANESRSWLIGGEVSWEIWEPASSEKHDLVQTLEPDVQLAPPRIAMVGLPATLVTCQLFWLETTDEKVVPDLIRMQCERRSLLRHGEVWTHRILRKDAERVLAQVLILTKTVPPVLEVEGEARFEALARCLALPPRAVSVWRSMGAVCFALTDESDVIYFQPLPHQTLSRECLRDIRAALWLAAAQRWVEPASKLVLLGDWAQTSASELEDALGLPVERQDRDRLVVPAAPMELTPPAVRQMRVTRRRQRRVKLVILTVAAIYALFVAVQAVTTVLTSMSNQRLKARLDSLMPRVVEMQTTARQLDALNPALDVKTYPMEILHRAVSLLPEKGVRLTRFEINGNRLEIGGESTTAREAFDYISNLEKADMLQHIEWGEAPQPIPLPNDTTRFSIQGTITGAFNESEES